MKELSIEEKAKTYDNAVINGSRLWECGGISRENYEYIFPELKESEDEKIRKEIIRFIRMEVEDEIVGNKWLAWLEKQKEPELSEDLGEYVAELSKQFPEVSFAKLSRIAVRVKNWLEKQGETDKESYEIAEKEKADFVGDGFIECHADFLDFKERNTYWLEYIGDDRYNVRSDNLLGKTYHITPCQLYTIFKKLTWLEKQKSSWSEEDEYMLNETIQHLEELIRIDKAKHLGCDVQYYQRDIDWLKNLKDRVQPQPKQEWSEDDNHEYFSELLENDNSDSIDDYAYQCAYCMSHDWLKESPTWDDVERACKLGAKWYEAHHKVRWSEEDKDFMYDTLSNLAEVKGRYGEGYGNVGKCIDWLKSLKDRVQPKQEWSVEDKLMLMSCIEIMQTVDSTEEQQNWLKSLRPQNKWRPSEEQIACLHDAVARYNREGFSAATLASLLEQLKKLKG